MGDRKECVRLSCQRQTKSPSGLSVGGLFAYRHAPKRLTSRTPWNKSSAYVSNTHYKSEIFKSIILSVLYHIRHFDVFVVKRKTLTFVKVYRLWGVVDDYHFVVIQLNFFYKVIGNLVSACQQNRNKFEVRHSNYRNVHTKIMTINCSRS